MSGEQILFKVDPSSIEGYLPAKGDAVIAALVERTTVINADLQAKIAGEKLQGQVLKSHTNKLAGSVRAIPTQNDGAKISGGVEAGGGPAYYAKWQEDGTTPNEPWIIEAKNAKALAFFPSGSMGAGAAGPLTAVQAKIGRGRIRNLLKAKSGPNLYGPLTEKQNALIKKAGASLADKGGAFGMVMVKAVLHPPLEAKKFMSGTLEEERESIVEQLQDAAGEAVQ